MVVGHKYRGERLRRVCLIIHGTWLCLLPFRYLPCCALPGCLLRGEETEEALALTVAFYLAFAVDRVAAQIALVLDDELAAIAFPRHFERDLAVIEVTVPNSRLLAIGSDELPGQLFAICFELISELT